jgi:hypothetical protein
MGNFDMQSESSHISDGTNGLDHDLSVKISPIKVVYRHAEIERIIDFFTFDNIKDEIRYGA